MLNKHKWFIDQKRNLSNFFYIVYFYFVFLVDSQDKELVSIICQLNEEPLLNLDSEKINHILSQTSPASKK